MGKRLIGRCGAPQSVRWSAIWIYSDTHLEEGVTASATSLDQTKMAAAAVGLAVTLALRESDPSLPRRAQQKALELHRVMRLRGEDEAANILLYFSSALTDQSLMPPEAA